MDRTEIATRARRVVADHFTQLHGKPVPLITDETDFVTDLGADSLTLIEVSMELEAAFDVEIPDDQAEANKTVGATVEWVA